SLKTRKGLDWTEKFGAIAKEARPLPDALIDGEIVARDHNGVRESSALQRARSEGKTGNLLFFAFDLLFVEDMDLRRLPLRERKTRLKAVRDSHGSDKIHRDGEI